MNSATVDLKALAKNVTDALNQRFSPTKIRYPEGLTANYLLSSADLPYITLDKRVFEAAGIDEKTAEDALAAALPDAVAKMAPTAEKGPATHRLPPTPTVAATYTRLQLAHGELPQTEMGRKLAHSYAYHGNWYVMLVLDGYQMQDQHGSGTTHFSPWSYDRHVPLAFYGTPFQPGMYRGRVEPVDLAATLASLLGVNQPSASVGRVLTQALKSPGR
jgi:hypothetical protein